MTPFLFIAAAVFVAFAVGVAAFLRPRRVILRSVIAVAWALVASFVIAYLAAPFLGDGAGMGVAFILYAGTVLVLLIAFAAILGVATRHIWTVLRGA